MSPTATCAPVEWRYSASCLTNAGSCVLELDSLPDGFLSVHRQTVDLNHTGIASEIDELASAVKRVREQVKRGGRFDDDVGVGSRAQRGADNLDHARRMAESVSRDVKDDAI